MEIQVEEKIAEIQVEVGILVEEVILLEVEMILEVEP